MFYLATTSIIARKRAPTSDNDPALASAAEARSFHGMPSPLPPLPPEPRPGRYRHYKGNEYRVIGLARHSETGEVLVVYQALYGERGLWLRPLAMFVENIGPASAPQPRFAFIAVV